MNPSFEAEGQAKGKHSTKENQSEGRSMSVKLEKASPSQEESELSAADFGQPSFNRREFISINEHTQKMDMLQRELQKLFK